MTPSTPLRSNTSPLRVAGYAAFLAASWTWVIGMYLPVILLRDYGWWSFVAFALPNCVGAAAMGVFLWHRGSSERFVREHAIACRLFSIVTLAFQVWFVGAMLFEISQGRWIILAGAVTGVVLGRVMVQPRLSWRTAAAFLSLFASLMLVTLALADKGLPPPLPPPTEQPLELLGLACVCVFGFALCPYLDLTFHAARQSVGSPAGSRTFLIGFLLLFPVMLALTAWYGWWAVAHAPANPVAALALLAAAHIAMQAWVTGSLHLSSIGLRGWNRWTIGLCAALAALLLYAAVRAALPNFRYHDLTLFELVYRGFMSFYGLLFPAYVLICAFGFNGTRPAPDSRTLAIFVAAAALAAPMFWLGFIEREGAWLIPGVFVVLLGKLLVKPVDTTAPLMP